MTQRKPPGLGWESWVDRMVREAEEKGEFDDLPGQGKPIPDLDRPYDENWWLRSYLRREGLSVLPASLELSRTVEAGLEAIDRLPSEAAVRRRVRGLNEEIARVEASAIDGPMTTVSPLDEEAIVAGWRRKRPPYSSG